MKRALSTCFILILLAGNSSAQQPAVSNRHKVDSLQAVLRSTESDSEKINILFNISWYYSNVDSLDKYINNVFRQTQALGYEHGLQRIYDSLESRIRTTTDDSIKIRLYYIIATATPDTALYRKQMNHGIALASEKKLTRLQVEGLNTLGKGIMGAGPSYFRQAIALYDSALTISMRMGDKINAAQSLHYLGEIYRVKGDYARALEYYNEGNIVANEARDTTQMMLNYHDLGWMRITMKNYEGSYEYLKQARALSIATKDSFWIGDNALHLGEAYWSSYQYDTSLYYSNQAMQVFTSLRDTGHVINAMSQLAWVYKSRKQWTEGERVLRDALKYAHERQQLVYQPSALLGDVLYEQGRYKEALSYYEKAAIEFRSLPIHVWKRDCFEGLAKTYAKLGDYKKAYEAQLEFKSVSDSVLILENAEKINATQAQHDFDKLKEEQEQKAALQTAELSKQKQQKYFFIAGGILLLIIAGGLVNRLLFVRKSKRQLEEKNKLIAEEKEIAEQQRSRAEQSEKFRQQFLANMSHEIRTPMNAIYGMSNLARDAASPEKQKEYLTGIQQSSENLIHIINDILDLSKVEAGKIELEHIDFSLREVIQQVKQTLDHKAEEKGIQLLTSVEENIPDVLMGDPVRLNQVLMNLCGNALKFTERGSVHLSIIATATEGSGKQSPNNEEIASGAKSAVAMTFMVEDTGIGIPKEKLNSIFESFTQAHSSDSRRFGGTGLGLTISKQLIELMGGELKVESEPGSGSTFSFTLELPVGTEQNLESRKKSEEEFDGSILNGLRILLADDNEYNRVVATDTLKSKADVTIVEATNGREAIELLEQQEFDVVLMDVQMPELDGFEATREIRNPQSAIRNHNVPIIALTASVIRSDLDKCKAAGMNEYVPKPFKASQLIHAIANVTGRSKSAQPPNPLRGELLPGAERRGSPYRGAEDSADETSNSIDLTYLKNFCEGDEARMKKYISMFLESIPPFTEKLEQAVAADDFAEIAKQVHAMKPKFMMMGMKEAHTLSIQIESGIQKSNQQHQFNFAIRRILLICGQAEKELSEWLNTP